MYRLTSICICTCTHTYMYTYNVSMGYTHSNMHTLSFRFPSLKVDIDAQLKSLFDYKERLRPMLCDTILYMNEAIKEKKKIVVEGANATMLDIDFGTHNIYTLLCCAVHVHVCEMSTCSEGKEGYGGDCVPPPQIFFILESILIM